MVRQQIPLKGVGQKKECVAHRQEVQWETRRKLEMLRTMFKRNAQKDTVFCVYVVTKKSIVMLLTLKVL